MCLLAIHVKSAAGVPLLLAANREEAYARPSRAPEVFVDSPPVLCGSDAVQGGTWLGVNASALTVAVTNRSTSRSPAEPRSRGLLCRDLLRCTTAAAAADLAEREFQSGRYLGANYLVADPLEAIVIHGGDRIERVPLSPGLHVLTNGDVDDPGDARQNLARSMLRTANYQSTEEFIAAAQAVCRHHANDQGEQQSGRDETRDEEGGQDVSIIIRRPDRGTVSSSIITLGDAAEDCR